MIVKSLTLLLNGNMGIEHSKLHSKLSNNPLKKFRKKSMADVSFDDTSANPSSNTNNVFKYENGRRYMNDDSVRYPLPLDDVEADRLQMQHFLYRYVWQSNFSAPIHEILKSGVAKVLDVGCGPGAWTLEMASDYPQTDFTGIDVSPLFPKEIRPANVNFLIHNITHSLPFEDNTFDYIHMRFMMAVLRTIDWRESVLPELYRILKPGGYIESHEFDTDIINQGPNYKIILDAAIDYLKHEKEIDLQVCPFLPGYLQESGFTNINIFRAEGSFGTSSRLGKIMHENARSAWEGMKSQLAPRIGLSEDEYLRLLHSFESEADEYKSAYQLMRFVAIKPIETCK